MFEDVDDKTWRQLCSLSEAEGTALLQELAEVQEWRWGLLNVKQLCHTLDLSRDAANSLPLKFLMPYRKTKRGLRQVRSVHKDDLRVWLTSLNPTYADYDADEGPLLRPSVAAQLLPDVSTQKLTAMRRQGTGSEFVRLNSRVVRYRAKDVLALKQPKSISDLIMEA